MHGIVGIPVAPRAAHFSLSLPRTPASAYLALATGGLAWMLRPGGADAADR